MQEAWEALGLMASCIGTAVVLATWWPLLLTGPLGWLLLGGGVLGALGALAATYWLGGRWGTALLSMGGTGLGAALLSYGAILYLRFFLI